MTLEFSRQIFLKTQISIFIKIRPVGAKLFHESRQTDRQTDGLHDEANNRFSQFSNAPNKKISNTGQIAGGINPRASSIIARILLKRLQRSEAAPLSNKLGNVRITFTFRRACVTIVAVKKQ